MVGNNKETTSGCFIQLVSDHTKISHATRVTAVWLEQPNCFYGDISALGLHDITFFTPWYIITHDITILLGGSVCVLCHASDNDGWPAGRSRLPVLLLASTDQDADFSNGCGDWKCFHPWLPLLVDIRGTLDGQAIVACPSHPLWIQNASKQERCFSLSSYSSISDLVSSLLALAGSTDTGLSLIARPATCISNSSIKSSQSNNGIATRAYRWYR